MFCQVDCCELDAFDVDAQTMLHYMRSCPENIELVGRQLDALIEEVAALDDVKVVDLCHEWPDGAACAHYLRTWREQFSRAMGIGLGWMPPEQRLAEAAQRGEYGSEVHRMANEVGGVEILGASLSQDARERVFAVLVALARLDPDAPGIRVAVEWARRVLNQEGVSWDQMEGAK